MAEFEIPQLDIVIVDLYPFEKTVSSGASEQDIIEKIDIGDRKSTRLNSSHPSRSRMPSSA